MRAKTEGVTPTPASDASATVRGDAGVTGHQLFLLVAGEGVLATEPLPAEGTVAIGRATDADVRIEDHSISRDHATLHLSDPLTIEDLGSANGTWVRNERIPPHTKVEIQLNQAVLLGSVTIVVQKRTKQLRMRRRRTHDYFENRLEEECIRGLRRDTTFMLVHIVGPTDSHDLEPAIVGALREGDLVAAYGPGEFEMILFDTDPVHSNRMIERLESALASRQMQAKIGTAWYPQDGREPNTLAARARTRAHGATVEPVEPGDLVIADERMSALHALVSRVAAADISVLLQGETGVGKEIVAEQLHRQSARSDKPFVRLNCAALSESLLESELFGHERGAFTGAHTTKQGLLEVASGGVVFLDEVGEMHASTQAKLLRVLGEGKLMRVGGLSARAIDVRIISATNRDLEMEVSRGTFRLDLLYRLNAMSIIIPPLRERTAEIEPLVRMFLKRIAEKYGRPVPLLTPGALAALREYSWPGNVRELRNVIERAMVLVSDDVIDVEDLPVEKMRATYNTPRLSGPIPILTPPHGSPAAAELTEEHQRILAALEECGGNQTHAARVLGISRRALINKIEKFAVRRPRKR